MDLIREGRKVIDNESVPCCLEFLPQHFYLHFYSDYHWRRRVHDSLVFHALLRYLSPPNDVDFLTYS